MAVRNFWLSARTDDSTLAKSYGPRTKDGGMDVTVLVREKGMISTNHRIDIACRSDGKTNTITISDNGVLLSRIEVPR